MDQMVELKQRLMDMMKWFHSFCVENNIRYYMVDGTMIGAVRHQGFIPWDDDIDVAVPREDYNRLAELFAKNPSDIYAFESEETDAKDYFYNSSKLYDTRTTLTENNKYKTTRGIFIDIFPLDGIGNNLLEANKNYQKIKQLNNLLALKVSGFRKGRKPYKNIGVALFRLIPLNPKNILKKIVTEYSSRPFEQYFYVANLASTWAEKEIVPRCYYGTPTLYQFEDGLFYGPEMYDEYLTSIYGDWRKLPPKEKQVTHHDFLELDLHKSYL